MTCPWWIKDTGVLKCFLEIWRYRLKRQTWLLKKVNFWDINFVLLWFGFWYSYWRLLEKIYILPSLSKGCVYHSDPSEAFCLRRGLTKHVCWAPALACVQEAAGNVREHICSWPCLCSCIHFCSPKLPGTVITQRGPGWEGLRGGQEVPYGDLESSWQGGGRHWGQWYN